MAKRGTVLFSQSDLSDTINIINYIDEFKKDFNVVFTSFTNSAMSDRAASESNLSIFHLPPMKSIQNAYDPKTITQGLMRIEQTMGMPLEKMLFADREFYKIYKENAPRSLTWLIDVWDQYQKIIEENNVLMHFCFGEDRLPNLIPYYLLRRRGGRSYLWRIVPYYGVTLTCDFFGGYTQDETNKLGHIDFDLYKSSIKESKVYFNSDIINKVNYGRYINVWTLLKRLMEIERINWEDRDNLYKNHNLRLINTFVSRPLNKKTKRFLAEKLVYHGIDTSQKYIYYPFHFTEDAQVRLKYPEGYNQYELIRNISKNLPANIRLLVKEHPAYVGNFSLKELFDLSKQPNITVVDPNISSKEIFSYCDHVITINSTVGYEALFFGKLVITLGKSFYDGFPGVIKLKDIADLYHILSDRALMQKKSDELSSQLKDRTTSLLESSLQFNYYDMYGKENITKMKDLFMLHSASFSKNR